MRKIELEKMSFYVTNGTKNDIFVKSFEEVIRTINLEIRDFIGKEEINLNKAKNIEELENMLEALNVKNKNDYEITAIYPVITDYDNKKILFYNLEEITEYFRKNYPDFYKENEIRYITDSYELLKLGIEVKEIWNAEFEKTKKKDFRCTKESKGKEIEL
jgi:hypothetical protein